jgi:hypothetical protein
MHGVISVKFTVIIFGEVKSVVAEVIVVYVMVLADYSLSETEENHK